MSLPSIEVILACPCMAPPSSPRRTYHRIDWVPGEYRVLTITEAAALLALHAGHPEPRNPGE